MARLLTDNVKGQGHQTQPHLKGLVCMCITFEVNTTNSWLDIEANGKMLTYRQTDRRIDGRTDEQTDRWTDRQMDRRGDGQTSLIH